MKTNGSWLRNGAALTLLAVSCLGGPASAQTPVVPVVTITADGFPARTAEPCPVCLVAPVKVIVSRTGSLAQPLSVGLRTGGTATSGVDYPALADHITIPAGSASMSFLFTALDDVLPEGPEVVEISITPVNVVGAGYIVGDPGRVYAVIGDDDAGAPSERLDFTSPANGAVFASGVASIRIRALAVSTTREIDAPVEFYANGILIGKSSPIGFGRPPIPWLPREHDFVWEKPNDGQYVLTARTPAGADQWLEASPIRITVGSATDRTRISIVATQPIAEEDSAPTMRPFIMRGEFTVSRTGSTANSQTVYLHVSGTAVPEKDYKPLPFAVSIPAGSASVKVVVEAIPDNIPEPLETVVAELSNCPPDHLMPPCFDFDIDPAHSRDTVFIRDDGITRASLEITAPEKGAHFSTGQDIKIDCTAIDIDDAITAIDFYAGDRKIGESRLFFLVQPPPGTPIYHTFTWTDAPAGTHTLTTRATAFAGTPVVSAPVTITVGGNQVPAVQITSPSNGAQFPSGTPIEITAAATDPDGYTGFAEFFANGHKIGEVVLNFLVEPPPGETQTYSFTWQDALPGSHMLSVRVRDDDGAHGSSAPVNIAVTVADALPVITVRPVDPFAVEPGGGFPVNTASFRLLRHNGSTAATLAVNYTLGGSATNGTDYQTLTGTAVFPAGSASVEVVVNPLADNLAEGRETVRLMVVPQFDDGPERYHVGRRNRALVIIADRAWQPPPDGHLCDAVGLGFFHLCFHPAAVAAPAYRIEATDDFRQWETVHEATAIDNAVHFVDPDTPELKRRFYRMAEDPTVTGP